MMPLLSIFAVALHLPAPSGGSDSWPAWRGANGSGVAEGSPPVEWSEEKNVRWKAPVPGKGLSSPVVWGKSVFLTTATGTGKKALPAEAGAGGERGRAEGGEGEGGERGDRPRGGRGRGRETVLEEQDLAVLALDRATGAVLWQKKVATGMPHQGTHPDGSYASATVATDGELVFASFGSFGLFALGMTGEVVWSVDLGDMRIAGSFGEGSSPILHGDLVVLAWEHDGDSFLVALDRKTGKERWRAPRPTGASWTTPIVVRAGGQDQIVVGGVLTAGYDPATGQELWHQGAAAGGGSGPIASPVAFDELVLFATSGRRGSEVRAIVAHAPAKEGEDADPLLWSAKIDAPHVPSPLAFGGKLYLLKQDSGMLSVVDPTSGEVEYGPERLEGVADVYASPVAAGGRIYVAGRDGTVEVLSAWPVETLAVNRLEDGFDASPAVAGDQLFLRGRANLYCIAEK